MAVKQYAKTEPVLSLTWGASAITGIAALVASLTGWVPSQSLVTLIVAVVGVVGPVVAGWFARRKVSPTAVLRSVVERSNVVADDIQGVLHKVDGFLNPAPAVAVADQAAPAADQSGPASDQAAPADLAAPPIDPAAVDPSLG